MKGDPMRSETIWLKKLATSSFKAGHWISESDSQSLATPFDYLRGDLLEAADIYNHDSSEPIRVFDANNSGHPIITLMHRTVQLRMTMNGSFLDISLIRTRQFQTVEQPIMRLSPVLDVFQLPIWRRGTVDWSSDQVIKTCLIQLIEASAAP
jgi:hypothetical protein